jgi:hypothetical protein
MTAKFKIDFRLFAISEVNRARTKGEDEKDPTLNDGECGDEPGSSARTT